MINNIVRPPLLAITLLVLAQCGNTKQETPTADPMQLSATDVEAIKKARKRYTNAWLAGDSTQVMQALTSDVVLIPHHGDMPIAGSQAIKEFWWPADALPSSVTEFTSTTDEIDGSGDMAFVRGRFKLVFTYGDQTYSNEGNYLNTVRKDSLGDWKLSRLIWNDPVATVD